MNLLQDDDSFNQWLGGVINDENFMDTTLTFIEQFDFVLKENGAVENRQWDCSDVAIENQPLMKCGEPELKKRKVECNNFPSSTDASLVKNDIRQGRPSSCSVDSLKLKGGKRQNRRGPTTNLSSLIDNNVVTLGQKVCYLNKKDKSVMAAGLITREGIKCLCCEKVYGISKYEIHAGSSSHRPSTNIFLEDGRSLMQCQIQIKHDDEVKGPEQDLHKQMERDLPHTNVQPMEDDINVGDFLAYLHEEMESDEPHPMIQQREDNVKDESFTGYGSCLDILQVQKDDDLSYPDIQQMEGDEMVEDFTGYFHEQFESNLPHPEIQQMEGDEMVEDFTGYFHEQFESNSPHPEIQQMASGNDVKGGYLHEQIESDEPHLKIQQMEGDDKVNNFTGHLHEETKSNAPCSISNGMCNICRHYGHELVICGGGCMSIFHLSCIGLKDFPETVWFCPSCLCGLCGGGEFNDGEQFVEKTILYCDQCERGYHVGCLRERGDQGLESCPEGNWFCGEKCSKIFFHLQNLLGKLNPTGVDGLSWTILRSNEKDGHDMTRSKLLPARSVLRECFKQIIQPITKTDLVTDVVFSKESTLPHLNFRGFYTMILYKGNKPITVATFRIHGEKVAELPLVGTRIRYHRRGMCQLLLNNLQKLLSDMGIEKLLLPAAPKLLQTWISSFGFVVMTTSDRFELLAYPFLEFTDTIMCQKLLMASTTKASESRESKEDVNNRFCRSNVKMDSHRHSNSSKVIQTMRFINTLPSKSIWLEDFGSEASNGKETSPHYSLRSNCSGSLALIQDPIWQTSAMKQTVTTLWKISAVEKSSPQFFRARQREFLRKCSTVS